MPAAHSLLKQQQTFPAYIRYPVLALTYVLIKPVLWLVDKAGYSDRLWTAVGYKMRAKLVEGHDFGDYRPSQHDVWWCVPFPNAAQIGPCRLPIKSRCGVGESMGIFMK